MSFVAKSTKPATWIMESIEFNKNVILILFFSKKRKIKWKVFIERPSLVGHIIKSTGTVNI